jgi:hypothetical protein
MAVIQSIDSADGLKIDPTPKAARVVIYDAAGNEINKKADRAYCTRLEVIPTTITLGLAYFAMKNTGARTVKLTRVELALNFSGTAAASRSVFSFSRFSGTTPTGGVAQNAVGKDSSHDASSVGDIRSLATGLTITGATPEEPFHLVSLQNQLAATVAQDLEFKDPIILAPGQGIMVRSHTAVVAGIALIGAINWTEHI